MQALVERGGGSAQVVASWVVGLALARYDRLSGSVAIARPQG